MADTPALGSQETHERLRRAYHYVSTVAEFQLKRFENFTVQSSSFSELNRTSFGLQPIAVDGKSRHIQFLRLFDGMKVREQLYSTRLVEFFQTHDAALQKELQTNLDSKEETLGKILGEFLFKPLVGEYRLARQEYREEEDSKTCYLGMGHHSSWHGWPDMVAGETPPAAGNTPIVLATTDKAEEESTESEPESEADSRDVEQSQEGQQSTGSSPGDKTVVEVKRRGLTGVLNQLVAQTVVFSYTMGNRHPDLKGESLSTDTACISLSLYVDIVQIQLEERGLCAEQVYNADEHALYWKAVPRKIVVAAFEQSGSGRKESKQKVSILVCCNTTGSHKLKPLLAGKCRTQPKPIA